MLRVQHLVLDIIRQLNPALTVLRRKDRCLEDQLPRAMASVALQVAVAFGYLPSLDPALAKQMLDATYMLASLVKRS
jgi:hypothetical protein